ncbi:MAG: hypothetical protein QOK44_1702 [Betaproteobacteria bacterium]|nr:hypothetical protein [Betaproteobacteria bacterium]
MRHPQDPSAAVGIIAAKPAPTAEPSRMPPHAPHDVNARIRPRRPSGARSTRNTIDMAVPNNSTLRNLVAPNSQR